jgi:hypothetical protein
MLFVIDALCNRRGLSRFTSGKGNTAQFSLVSILAYLIATFGLFEGESDRDRGLIDHALNPSWSFFVTAPIKHTTAI